MKKLLAVVACSALVFMGTSTLASAQTAAPDIAALEAQVQQLTQQIAQLQAQLADMQKTNATLQSNVTQLQQTLQLSTPLHRGMRGEDVKRLQEILATDPTLYSKDYVTSYYGPLTEKAVTNFQKHFGIDQVGVVGPITLEKLNELLKEHDATDTESLSENELGDLGDDNEVPETPEAAGASGEGEGSSSTSSHGGD